MHTSMAGPPASSRASRISITVAASLDGSRYHRLRLPPPTRLPVGPCPVRPRSHGRARGEGPRVDQGADGQLPEAAGSAISQAWAPRPPPRPRRRHAGARRRPSGTPGRPGPTRPRSPGCPSAAMARTSRTRSARRMNSPVRNMPERVAHQIGDEVLEQGRAAAGSAAASGAGRSRSGGPSPTPGAAPWCGPRRGRAPRSGCRWRWPAAGPTPAGLLVDEGGGHPAAERVTGHQGHLGARPPRRGTARPSRRSRRRCAGRARSSRVPPNPGRAGA